MHGVFTGHMATNKIHEGTCSLCKKANVKCTHQCTVISEKLKVYEPSIDERACICLPCTRQLKRLDTNPTLRPRWFPKTMKTARKCDGQKCTNTIYRSTNPASIDENEHLHERIDANLSKSSVDLCWGHYQHTYWALHDTCRPCDCCGAKPTKGEHWTRQ